MQRVIPQRPCAKIVHGQEELTEEQSDYVFDFYVDERVEAMLSTQPVDEAEVEAHLRQAYQVARLCPPTLIHWFDSPGDFLSGQGEQDERKSVEGSVLKSLEERVWKNTKRKLENRINFYLGFYVWEAVMQNVGDIVLKEMWNSLSIDINIDVFDGSEFDDRDWDMVKAYNYAGRLANARFLHEFFEPNDLIHLARFNELVSGYSLEKEQAWLVRKPVRLCRDEQGRLHSPEGMCIQYCDRWGFYAWHGVVVPEQLILHPQTLTRQDWLRQDNLEVRRAMTERLGPERFIKLVGGTCIDEGSRGSLIAVDLGDDPERVAHYMRVRDSSSEREYYLRVPPSIHRADEAVAWTFGMTEAAYRPGQET